MAQPDFKTAAKNPTTVPLLVKSGVVHVYETLRGSPVERFEGAFNIIVWRLSEGTEKPRLKKGTLTLTREGNLQTRKRLTDRKFVARLREFDRLAKVVATAIERKELTS